MPARLTIHFASAPARELLLPDGEETVVGRGADCGVVIEDDRVSRRHAALAPGAADPSDWRLRDLGSKNGTLVDGVPAAGGRLPEKAWLSFGGVLARFEALSGRTERLQKERQRRLTSALAARRELDPSLGLPQLLTRVVSSMLSLTGAERGFLLLSQPDGELQVAARSGLSWDDLRAASFGGSVGAVERALRSGRPVVSADARADAELGARASVLVSGIRALACVPVQAAEQRLGVMYADSRKPGATFTELDVEILEALAAQAGLAIAVARLDGELRGLAGQLGTPAEPEGDDPLSETWHGLVAAHSSLGARR